MRAASCEETARPMSSGLEFDVELAQHTAVDVLPSGDAEAEPAHGGMCEVRKTRKGEWWQLHGWSAAVVRCAAVMPSAECVGRHGPEELWHQMLRPANVVSERLAMDTRLIGEEVLEPQLRLVGYAHVCSLRGICLRLNRRDAFALQRHWRPVIRRWQQRHSRLPLMWRVESDIWWQRPVHDGPLHHVTALHGDAGCSSASPFWAKWELQSHTRGVFHSLLPSRCGCVDQFAARGSRTSPAPDAWLRAHQNVGSGGFFTDSCAHDHHRQQTVGQTMQTVRTNCRSLSHDKRQTRLKEKPFDLTRFNV